MLSIVPFAVLVLAPLTASVNVQVSTRTASLPTDVFGRCNVECAINRREHTVCRIDCPPGSETPACNPNAKVVDENASATSAVLNLCPCNSNTESASSSPDLQPRTLPHRNVPLACIPEAPIISRLMGTALKTGTPYIIPGQTTHHLPGTQPSGAIHPINTGTATPGKFPAGNQSNPIMNPGIGQGGTAGHAQASQSRAYTPGPVAPFAPASPQADVPLTGAASDFKVATTYIVMTAAIVVGGYWILYLINDRAHKEVKGVSMDAGS